MKTSLAVPAATAMPPSQEPQVIPMAPRTDWVDKIAELGPRFASRAENHDQDDSFVADNYADLKAAKIFSAGIPASLGGGDASFGEMCEMIRVTAHACGSTALSLSMHFHLIAALAWKWRNQKAPVDGLLRRVVDQQLVLVSSGGSDWLHSSGKAEATDGGFLVQARKAFSSGSPVGDLLMASAIYQDPALGPTVLHFPVDLRNPAVKMISTWRTLGMRGTGSNDIEIDGLFVASSDVSVRRPRGKWHPALHLVSKVALPMVYSAYLGLAEQAREIALREVSARRDAVDLQYLAGDLENELFTTRIAHERMVEIGSDHQPGPETTNEVLKARSLTARSAIRTVEKAIELVGGHSYYRDVGLERLYRDVQAARFHPVPDMAQRQFTGRLALGLAPDAS